MSIGARADLGAPRPASGEQASVQARTDMATLSFTLLFTALIAAFLLSLDQAVPSLAINDLFTTTP